MTGEPFEACVVVADVVGSREVEDRGAFGRTLRNALARMNDRHADELAADFAVLKGVDEFAGVLATPTSLVAVVTDLQAALHPVSARYAAVEGTIDVEVDADDVRRMDGPAFHRADELLADLRDGRFALELDEARLAWAVTAGLDVVLARRENWTERQVEVVESYSRHGTQRATADALDVSQQAVSRVLTQADHGRVRRAERLLADAMGSD